MNMRKFTGIPDKDRLTSQDALKRLRVGASSAFAAGEAALVAVGLVFYFTDRIGGAGLGAWLAVCTVVVAALCLLGYFFARTLLIRACFYETGLISITNILTDAVLFLDHDLTVTHWSRGAERVFGYTEDEAVGKSAALILPEGEPQGDIKALPEFSSDYIERHRVNRRRKDGASVTVEISASRFTPPGEREAGYLMVIRDVSRQKEMERKLTDSEERYRNLYESTNDGIFFMDTEGRITQCNRAFAELLGYEPGELVGSLQSDLTPPEWRQVDEDVIVNQLRQTGYSDEYTKEFKKRDGAVIPVSVRVWTVDGSGDGSTGAWAIVRDISERRKYENFIRDTIIRLEEANDRLRELDELKTEFVGMVSHELRAPLSAFETSLRALEALDEVAGSPEGAALMGVLDRGVRRLTQLVDDLLDITRIESGQLRLDTGKCDAVEMVDRNLNLYMGSFIEKGLELEFKHPDGPVAIECDNRRVGQVLTNLLSNALKFTDSGTVTVEIDKKPTRVVFSISDTGPGVPVELHTRVFEKFFSQDARSKGEKQGVGLGLAISKGIVEAHGGAIWVESPREGGAVFRFDLPLTPDHATID